ncbi:MAG: hypothetical protein JJ863_26345 [Deltaproteobacteria bacterium]|nr:hypothetical protein [Deltaproteobacteria bacterium]
MSWHAWALIAAGALLVSAVPARAHFVDDHWAIPAEGSNRYDPSVALDDAGDRLVVGMPGEVPRTLGPTRGRVRVMRRVGSGWAIEASLDGSAASSDAFSGAAVAIDASGNRIASGGPAGDGHVRVFVRSGTSWTEEAMLRPSEANGGFGVSVALSDDGALLAVGWEDVQRVDVYRRSGSSWSLSDTLGPDMARSEFGRVVEVADDGSRVFVGAPGARMAFDFAFDGVSWIRTAIAPASSRPELGQSLAVVGSGTQIAVGSVRSVLFFAWDGVAWVEGEELTGTGNFGVSVALSADGQHLAVGEPSHVPVGEVHTFARDGGAWVDDGVVAGGALQDPIGATVAFARGSVDWLIAGGIRDSAGGTGGALLFGRVGDPCADPSVCPTGHCVDGVCCEEACPDACETCLSSAPGVFPGACARLTGAEALAVVCHPATGPCHPAITCADTGGRSCPSDEFLPAGTICNESLGPCDRAETCDGVSAACPVDELWGPERTCRGTSGACDVAERCEGTSVECPEDDLLPAGTVCRAPSGDACDVPERCDGTSRMCPDDVPMCDVDGGVPETDAGVGDAGTFDGGLDGGAVDAGTDAGGMVPDAAADRDLGTTPTDGGNDASLVSDAGSTDGPEGGCGCRTSSGDPAGWFLLGVFFVLQRRRARA